VIANFDFRLPADNFGGGNGFTLNRILNGGSDGLSDPLIEDVGAPAKIAPDSGVSPQDNEPVQPRTEDSLESTLAYSEVGAARRSDDLTWFQGSLNGPAGERVLSALTGLEAQDEGPADISWMENKMDDRTELVLVAAALAGIHAVVGEPEKNGPERSARDRVR
jgi:hypothetical protein